MKRRVIFTPPDYFSNPPERTAPMIEISAEMDIDPDATMITPSTEPAFIYTSPKPGLEGIGVIINDRRLGPYALMLGLEQAKFIARQLAEMITNIDTIRLEHDYHKPGDQQ